MITSSIGFLRPTLKVQKQRKRSPKHRLGTALDTDEIHGQRTVHIREQHFASSDEKKNMQ
ncbi:hypothetical protein HAX54_012040, partial [Datura stramonium]|nr:hypothetical protein [Datura stramonium]